MYVLSVLIILVNIGERWYVRGFWWIVPIVLIGVALYTQIIKCELNELIRRFIR